MATVDEKILAAQNAKRVNALLDDSACIGRISNGEWHFSVNGSVKSTGDFSAMRARAAEWSALSD